MIAIIERELVEKKRWINHEEFMDLIGIAESTPGPIAINSATYIGYKVCGVLGSVFATLGVVLPSLIIIFSISLFFDAFLSLTWVGYAFRGIQACVCFLILNAGIKMFKKLKKTAFNLIITIVTVVWFLSVNLFAVNFSSVFFILIGGLVGIIIYLISYVSKREKVKKIDGEKGDEK
jgi:chromate transporter